MNNMEEKANIYPALFILCGIILTFGVAIILAVINRKKHD